MAPVYIRSLMILLWVWGNVTGVWGQAARLPGPTPLPAAQTPAASGGVSLQGNVLSVQIQDEELRTVLQNIATQGNIELRHMEGIPDQRISIQFSALPVVEGLKRLLRMVEIPGYAIITAKQGKVVKVQRIVFVGGDATSGGTRRSGSSVASLPTSRSRAVSPRAGAQEGTKEGERSEPTGSTSVFEDLKTNATARRLVNQLMHPNEQVRERALESLVRLVREDDKQRDLLEFVEPLMEDLAAEDKETQEAAREEIRQLLRR